MLEQITPIILTYDEAPNIGRTLERLRWARDIIVVDSFSHDGTLGLVSQFPQARVFQRKFDCLENQWNYALTETDIHTDWVLALDADYITTTKLMDEIQALDPPDAVNGYRARFAYCVYGQPLRGSAYQPVIVLFRRSKAFYRQDGHAHRVVVSGQVEELHEIMLHDDWKLVARWLQSQCLYQQQEADKLLSSDPRQLSWPDRIRKRKFASPFLTFLYCLFIKRGILDGKAGLYYAFQRMLAETILSVYLIDRELARPDAQQDSASQPVITLSKS
jgi:glycosyltransferase involved in cell wall biosynthesis